MLEENESSSLQLPPCYPDTQFQVAHAHVPRLLELGRPGGQVLQNAEGLTFWRQDDCRRAFPFQPGPQFGNILWVVQVPTVLKVSHDSRHQLIYRSSTGDLSIAEDFSNLLAAIASRVAEERAEAETDEERRTIDTAFKQLREDLGLPPEP